MKSELRNVIKYDTWQPMLPSVKVDKIIHSLMMAVQKFTASGAFAKWKGRLAAMGNKLEFDPSLLISSPTIDMASLFILLALANHMGLDIESFDVPSAYLNCSLLEDVYMALDKETSTLLIEIDPNYKQYLRHNGTIVVKLLKSLYGLRQSGANWYNHITDTLIELGYESSHTDPCTFVRREGHHISIVGIYVDDCLFFGTNTEWQTQLKDVFRNKYNVNTYHSARQDQTY